MCKLVLKFNHPSRKKSPVDHNLRQRKCHHWLSKAWNNIKMCILTRTKILERTPPFKQCVNRLLKRVILAVKFNIPIHRMMLDHRNILTSYISINNRDIYMGLKRKKSKYPLLIIKLRRSQRKQRFEHLLHIIIEVKHRGINRQI